MLNKTLTAAKGPITHNVFEHVPTPPSEEPVEGADQNNVPEKS